MKCARVVRRQAATRLQQAVTVVRVVTAVCTRRGSKAWGAGMRHMQRERSLQQLQGRVRAERAALRTSKRLPLHLEATYMFSGKEPVLRITPRGVKIGGCGWGERKGWWSCYGWGAKPTCSEGQLVREVDPFHRRLGPTHYPCQQHVGVEERPHDRRACHSTSLKDWSSAFENAVIVRPHRGQSRQSQRLLPLGQTTGRHAARRAVSPRFFYSRLLRANSLLWISLIWLWYIMEAFCYETIWLLLSYEIK